MAFSTSIPHGGILVNRENHSAEALKQAEQLPALTVSDWSISDLELIGIGGFSPLTGFMGKQDYETVVENMRLSNGLIWSIPITLPVTEEEAGRFETGETLALKGADGVIYGTLTLEEKYTVDKEREARLVYGTTDPAHPGVKRLYENGDVYLAGRLRF